MQLRPFCNRAMRLFLLADRPERTIFPVSGRLRLAAYHLRATVLPGIRDCV